MGLSAEIVPGGKPGPRRTKSLVISDTVGPSLQRKGDIMANQDTCLTALRGMWLPQIFFEKDLLKVKANNLLLFFSALRQIILVSGTLLKDDIHKVNI